MKFIIKEPLPFYSYLDEKNFFRWLESIPAVKNVVGTSKGLELSIEMPIDEPNLRDLIAIMKRYSLDMKSLKTFCDSTNDAWFKNQTAYWYKSVFDD